MKRKRSEGHMSQEKHSFCKEITKKVHLDYLLFLPKEYGKDPQKKWPCILFLHGAGERGNDLELLKKHGIPKVVEQREDFPFIAISPQCPQYSRWSMEIDALCALLDEVIEQYDVDLHRIYLTGLSMGGFGTWQLAQEIPWRFAAIAPICGGGIPEKACALVDVPIWVFHGAKDPVVPIQESERMVEAVKACGGDIRFTVYPDAEHDSWTRTYDHPALYDWFLQHVKK